jgi:hypothetical protein
LDTGGDSFAVVVLGAIHVHVTLSSELSTASEMYIPAATPRRRNRTASEATRSPGASNGIPGRQGDMISAQMRPTAAINRYVLAELSYSLGWRNWGFASKLRRIGRTPWIPVVPHFGRMLHQIRQSHPAGGEPNRQEHRLVLSAAANRQPDRRIQPHWHRQCARSCRKSQ